MRRHTLAALAVCLALTALPWGLLTTRAQDATPMTSPSAGTAGSLFADVTDVALPSPQPCGPGGAEGCYSNYVRLADRDGDADLDIVFANGGGCFSRGGGEDLQPRVIDGNDGNQDDGTPR